MNEQLVINDAALAGFGSLLTSIGTNNIQKTRNFTKRMRTAYPHIYMFEGLTSVDPENKAQHQEKCRSWATQTMKSLVTCLRKTL